MSCKLQDMAVLILAGAWMIAAARPSPGQAVNTLDAAESRPALLNADLDHPVSGTTAAARDAQFELGVGDVIHVSVWRDPELTQTAVVRPDGRISLPLAGEVQLLGKTTISAQTIIRTLLLKYVTDPQVTVSVVEIHSRQVFITGQVQRPGAYPLLGSCNVLQLIASAGGLTPYAHKRNIVVLDAAGRRVSSFDYASAVKGDLSQDRSLLPGETVVIP